MADAPEGGGSTFGFLARRIGPVPVWLILVVGGIAIFWYENRANGGTGLFGGLLGRGNTAASSFSLTDSTGAVTETVTGAPDKDTDKDTDTDKPKPRPVPVHRGHLPPPHKGGGLQPLEKEDGPVRKTPVRKPVKAGTPHAGTHVRHNHQKRRAPEPEPGPEVQKVSEGPSKFTESGSIPAGTATTPGSQTAEQFVDVTAHRPLGL